MARTASTRTPWWSRSRGLPAETHSSWVESLPAGAASRILAWARTPDGFCIGSPARLSYTEDGSWRHVGWHVIERGGWNAESAELSWTELAAPGERGVRGSVALSEPGRLPELFRERVSATIAVEKFVALSGAKGVVITARRDLSKDGSISWHSTLTKGLTWETPGVPGAVDEALTELRMEYDLS